MSSSTSRNASAGRRPSQRPVLRPSADLGPSVGEVSLAGSIGVTNTTYVEGSWAAYLLRSGWVAEDFLYQIFSVPSDIENLTLDLWTAVTTLETDVGTDFFCVAIWRDDLMQILVDLGCLDATDTTGLWQETIYTLSSPELTAVKGQSVAILFELYNAGGPGTGTAGWVDFVQVYGVGGSGGGSLDPNEPNNDPATATTLACSASITTSIIGDAVGGYDEDWFILQNVPSGVLEIDIKADTKVPTPSELDSVVSLYDVGNPADPNTWTLIAFNDDDGVSYDSYLTYTNTISPSDFYVKVASYSGYGSPNSTYDITAYCAGSGGGAPPIGNEQPPTSSISDTWTIMLYLNAEDPGFESTLTQYRQDIEGFIGTIAGTSVITRDSPIRVVILYDGPSTSGQPGTMRYLVQPNGNYTDNVNRWNRGELNMGHPDTLANFVNWAMDQYPADHYYLAIDDHGDGVYGISADRTSNNDLLTPTDVYAALKNATRNGNRKIDIFDYEACLMGLAENAYDVKDWVNYVIFFEQISWAINTYPTYFSDLSASDDPLTVGQRIIDRYYNEALAANGGKGFPHTISLIDTSGMAAVKDAASNLGDALSQNGTGNQSRKDAVNNARDNSQVFANDDDATNPARGDYVDLWDFANEAGGLAPSQAAAVKSAVDAAVAAERHASGGVAGYIWDHSGAHGLAIYYPTSTSSNAFGSYGALYQMSANGTWDEFLAWAVPEGNRRGLGSARAEDRLAGDFANAFAFKYIYLPVTIK